MILTSPLLILLQRYDPVYDGPGPTPLWMNLVTVAIILICLWNEENGYLHQLKKEGNIDLRRDFKKIIACYYKDFKDRPFSILAGVAVFVSYWLVGLYSWMIYVLMGLAAIGFLIWAKFINK